METIPLNQRDLDDLSLLNEGNSSKSPEVVTLSFSVGDGIKGDDERLGREFAKKEKISRQAFPIGQNCRHSHPEATLPFSDLCSFPSLLKEKETSNGSKDSAEGLNSLFSREDLFENSATGSSGSSTSGGDSSLQSVSTSNSGNNNTLSRSHNVLIYNNNLIETGCRETLLRRPQKDDDEESEEEEPVNSMPSRFNPRARDFVPNNMVSRTINSSQVQPRFYSPQTKASLRHQMSNSDNVPLVDSMSDDNLLNEFFEKMKQFKREQYKQACKYVEYCLEVFPPNLHDKLFLEIAERAKRANELQESQRWYQRLNVQKKHFVQGWLDHAKLMEEQGFLSESVELLLKGLSHCGINEQLVSKLLKLYELQGNYVDARGVLSRLRDLPLEKSWKMLLEGALLESRIGNLPTARKVFRYLLDNLHPHGPIYYEAYKAEASCEEYENALAFVEEGLSILPKYGPLWFALFHLLEKLGEPHERLRESLDKAVLTISKELVWKVYFEGGQIEERQWNLVAAREFYEKSAQQALVTLRWKVWMAWARLELMDDNEEAAKSFLDKALREVPAKTKSVILLECTRVEEYFKKLDKAREYIMQAQNEAKHEWKVFLEAVLLEMRCGNIQRAIHQVQEALKVHQRTGRLWALLIQLQYVNGEEAQLKEFMLALKEVPKSGEVWCEGARIRMNPTYACFDLEKAQEYLRYAINFTPQYGDSFIEYLKLQLLLNGPSQQWSNILEFSPDDGNNNNSKTLSYFEQKCVVADPNYGPLWYFCKVSPMDSTREVLKRAKQLLLIELSKNKEIFQTRMIEKHSLPSTAGKTSLPSENNFASQNYQDSNVIFTIYNNKDNKNDLNLMNQLNSDMQQQQNYHVKFVERERFITALPYLLQTFNCTNLELSTRRKLIFGFSDNIA